MKKLILWMKNHYLISSIIWAIVGAIISWGLSWLLPSSPITAKNIPQKELTCTLNYVHNLVSINTNDKDFKIIYKDTEIKSPYVANITIKNTGDYAINNDDFKSEFSIDIKGGNQIIKASLIKADNKDIWDEILNKSSIINSQLIFSDFFLNPNEEFTISIITDQKPETIIYNARIAGISNLNLVNTQADKIANLKTTRNIIITVVLVATLISIIIITISYLAVKKERKKLKEYLKNIQ